MRIPAKAGLPPSCLDSKLRYSHLYRNGSSIEVEFNKTNRFDMKKILIIMCAVAALTGCSRKGGTGTGSTSEGGYSGGSRYDTNAGGTNPTNTNTNRFGTDQGGSRGTTTPQGSGTP